MSEKFKYSYSAPSERERKEIEYIQKQYQKKDERQLKLERLRNLDNKVKSFPALIAFLSYSLTIEKEYPASFKFPLWFNKGP